MATLSGKKGLIVGIANEHSLAYGYHLYQRQDGALCASAGASAAKRNLYALRFHRAQANSKPFSGASLRTGDASISCNTLTPARKPPRRSLETLPTSMPAIASWLEGGDNSFTVTAGFFAGL